MVTLDDLLDEMCKEFPEIERSSIKKICKKGLYDTRKILTRNEELIIQGKGNKEVKFFIPLTPENQAELTACNVNKRRYYEKRSKKHI